MAHVFLQWLTLRRRSRHQIALSEMLGWLLHVNKTWLTGTRRCWEVNAGGQRAPFAHTPSLLSITAPMPQPVYRKHSIRSITQEFCPCLLVPGHWRSFPSCSLSPHPSILQGSHTLCIFKADGTTLTGAVGSMWQDVLAHLSTNTSAEIRH